VFSAADQVLTLLSKALARIDEHRFIKAVSLPEVELLVQEKMAQFLKFLGVQFEVKQGQHLKQIYNNCVLNSTKKLHWVVKRQIESDFTKLPEMASKLQCINQDLLSSD